MTSEQLRLQQSRDRTIYWKRWEPYLSERAWGTVREDYSADGAAWDYLPHDQARSKAYRWGEDGLAGISDRHQQLCFALALWNGRDFLEKIFQKLLLNFTWWVNRKDYLGQNVFQGGFLGLDNIGVFDRNLPLPDGSFIEQSDGTSWMGMYCLNMLTIALELAQKNYAYSDIASKFFEHFIYIAHAMNDLGVAAMELWNEEDGFYYDVLHHQDDTYIPLKVRSMVSLIPLFAITILESELLDRLPSFKRRMQWFIDNWEDIDKHMERVEEPGHNEHILLSIVNHEKLPRILKVMLDEAEFLSS